MDARREFRRARGGLNFCRGGGGEIRSRFSGEEGEDRTDGWIVEKKWAGDRAAAAAWRGGVFSELAGLGRRSEG